MAYCTEGVLCFSTCLVRMRSILSSGVLGACVLQEASSAAAAMTASSALNGLRATVPPLPMARLYNREFKNSSGLQKNVVEPVALALQVLQDVQRLQRRDPGDIDLLQLVADLVPALQLHVLGKKAGAHGPHFFDA